MTKGKGPERLQAMWPHCDTSPWLDAFEGLRKALDFGPHWDIAPKGDYSTAWVIHPGCASHITPRKPNRKVNRNR